MHYLNTPEKVLQKLVGERLNINTSKELFRNTKTEYLDLFVIKDSVKPLSYKVESINYIDATTKVQDVRFFVGLINYYREMWHNCAHTLARLPKLCSNRVKFKWTDLEQNTLTVMNKTADLDLLILCHTCSEELIIDTHDNKMKIGE